MIVNGKEIILQKEISVIDFLKKEGYDATKVAVEKNGGIVPKKNFEVETISDIDKIEIVSIEGVGTSFSIPRVHLKQQEYNKN